MIMNDELEAKTSFEKVMNPTKISLICQEVASKLAKYENLITSTSDLACFQKMIMLPTAKTQQVLSDDLKSLEEEVKSSSIKDAIESALADSKSKLAAPFENLGES